MMASRKKPAALPPPRARTAVVVLGMHRSGTSALSGVLGQMGCDLPQDLMAPTEINVRGFFESNRISGLNESLLASAGHRWFSFPRVPADWFGSPKADEFLERAREAIGADFGRSHLFVLKDPRICRLLPFWQRALSAADCQPAFVCIHRHPQDVADSLTHWGNYDTDYGLLLWLRHVLEAEAGSRGQPRVFTSYDRLMTDWAGTVQAIGKGLGLKWPRSLDAAAPGVEGFLSADLRHFSQKNTASHPARALSDWVAQTYAILEAWAAAGERTADHQLLDHIRTGLDQAGPSFTAVTWRSQEQRLEIQHLQQRIEHLEGPVQTAHLEALHQARAEMDARVAELSVARDQLRKASASHEANHRTEQQNRAAAESQAADLRALLDLAGAEAEAQAALYQTEHRDRQAAEAQVAELSETINHTRAKTEVRTAELSGALDQLRAERDGGHAEAERLLTGSRAAAQDLLMQLTEAELTLRSLQEAGAALEEDLRRSEELRATAENDAAQLRSALIQRGQEADDLHRQNVQDAQRLASLEAALDAVKRDHAALSGQDDRNSRHLDILTRRLTAFLAKDLENRLHPPVDPETVNREHLALIADYETRLTWNRKARAEAQTELASAEAEKAALDMQAEALRGQMVTRGDEVLAVSTQLEASQSERAALSTQLARLETGTAETAATLRGEVQQLRAERQSLKNAAEALQHTFERASAKEDQLQGQLTERQQEVKQTRDQLTALSTQTARDEKNAAATATALRTRLEHLETERQSLKTATEALSGRLEKASVKEDQLQLHLRDRLQDIKQSREELAELTKEHKSTLRRVGLLREQKKAYEQRQQGLEAEVEGLLGSLSWRVTKPVRAMSNMLRRVVPGRK